MNKQRLIKNYHAFLAKFKLEPKEALVGAGGAMVVHGLREETADIDIDLSPSKIYLFEGYPYHDYDSPVGKTRSYELKEFELELYANDTIVGVIVDGVYVYDLSDLLRFKTKLNRPKDQKDIQALKKALGKDNWSRTL